MINLIRCMLKPIHVIICVVLIIVSFTALNQFKEEIVVAIIDTEFNRDIVKKNGVTICNLSSVSFKDSKELENVISDSNMKFVDPASSII